MHSLLQLVNHFSKLIHCPSSLVALVLELYQIEIYFVNGASRVTLTEGEVHTTPNHY